jgi:hypothetical protein
LIVYLGGRAVYDSNPDFHWLKANPNFNILTSNSLTENNVLAIQMGSFHKLLKSEQESQIFRQSRGGINHSTRFPH